MSVEERIMSRGQFALRLKADTPREVVDQISEFALVYVMPARPGFAQDGLYPSTTLYPAS